MAPALSQVILGGWLFASAFLWPHSDGQFLLATWGGLLLLLFSVAACLRGRVDKRIRTVAWWLLFGAFVLPATDHISVSNDVIVGIGSLAFLWLQQPPTRQPS